MKHFCLSKLNIRHNDVFSFCAVTSLMIYLIRKQLFVNTKVIIENISYNHGARQQNEAYRQRKFELMMINARIVHKCSGTPPHWTE